MSKPQILFNKPENGNFWLTNFQTGYPIKARLPSKLTSEGKIAGSSVFLTDELEWETSEHLFQALKYSQVDGSKINLALQIQAIRGAKSPDGARKFTRGNNEKLVRSD